jgi:hypothetical protein
MKHIAQFLAGFVEGLKKLPEILAALRKLPGQLKTLWRYFCRVGFRCLKPRPLCKDEIRIPPEVYKRPDPMLYSQQWLMSMSLSVTWDNPDIQLYHNGTPVPSAQLDAETEYEVRVRVWNNSYDAPAPGLPVHLTYFGFGVGTGGVYVGKRIIDLGAKGTSQCPAFASFVWKTPSAAGHYCLQARLDWLDDANPQNNMGQENTNVATMQSPALFTFRARNNASVPREFVFEVDDYRLPQLDPCDDKDVDREQTRIEESRERWATTRSTQGYGLFDDWKNHWSVAIDPAKPTLDPNQEIDVKVSIEPLDPGFSGSKPFNVNAFAVRPDVTGPREFVGGVTLVVESA